MRKKRTWTNEQRTKYRRTLALRQNKDTLKSVLADAPKPLPDTIYILQDGALRRFRQVTVSAFFPDEE